MYYVYTVIGLGYVAALAAAIGTLMIVRLIFERFLPPRGAHGGLGGEHHAARGRHRLLLETVILVLFGEKQRGMPPMVTASTSCSASTSRPDARSAF